MFKVIPLAVLVSVVWSTAQATYILDNDGGFSILGSADLDAFHGSILQSDASLDYGNHNHHPRGLAIPHISSPVRYINQPENTFSKNHDTNPWKPVIKHNTARHNQYYPHSEQNKQLHQNQILHQRHIEVKSSNAGFNVPHIRNHHAYFDHQLRSHVPSGLLLNHGSFILENDDYDSIGHHHGIGKILQIPRVIVEKSEDISQQKIIDDSVDHHHGIGNILQIPRIITEKSEDISQQKIVDVDVQKSPDQKSVSKVNIKGYGTDGQNDNLNDYDENQKTNQEGAIKKQENGNTYVDSQQNDHNNEKVYRVVYNQGHQAPAQYLKLHEENGGYVLIPSSLGSHGSVYRGIDGVQYHSGLNSHGAIRLDHNIPILLNGNLDDHSEILIGHRNEAGHVNLGGIPYILLGSNISQSEGTLYLDEKKDDSDEKLEQKPEPVEQKSEDSGSDYKGNSDAKYSDSGKDNSYNVEQKSVEVSSYNVEQKSLDVGLKDQKIEQTSSYDSNGGNDQSYNDAKNPKYEATSPQKSIYGLEQKSLEIGIKTTPNVEYDGIGSTKSTNKDTQQKLIDTEYKDDSEESDYKSIGSSNSEYPGIGSIDDPKYPDLKSSKQNLEQKSIQTETYSEVKATFKSSHGISGVQDSLSKDNSDYTKSAINSLKKDIDAKISGYKPLVFVERKLNNYGNQGHPTSNGGSSTSYFNSGHPSTVNHHQRPGSPYSHSSGIQNARPRLGGSSHSTGSSNYPKQSGGSYFSLGNNNSPGNTVNYHRPPSKIDSYQRPLSASAQRGGNSYSNRQSTHGGIGRAPSFLGHRTPTYKEVPSGRFQYSGSPDSYKNEKSLKVNYEYPSHSLKKDEPIYASSVKPTNSRKRLYPGSNTNLASRSYQGTSSGHPVSRSHLLSSSRSNTNTPATIQSYLKRENTPSESFPSYPKSNTEDLKITSGADYSNGIGGLEYPGIGEKSPASSADTKPKSYSTSQDTKYPTTDQKSDDSEESIPTYSDSKIDAIKPSGEEYKGIGEIGAIPPAKSEIVGGRYPVKRPVSTKASPNRIKGKNGEKTEQKYLPITSTLSDVKSGSPDSKPYSSSVKTKIPEKVEQQEDLVYEAFLAGEGPQNHAVGSSGYGFNRPNAGSGGSPPYGSSDKDEHHPPMPYEFEFDIQDDEYGSEQYRKEKMDDSGYLTGSYGFKDAEGLYRQVEYQASKEGFKVNSIKTNEPGTDNENPADVHFEVHKQR